MTIDVLALPNVRIHDSILTGRPPTQYKYTLSMHKEFKEVLEALIPKYPQWDFEFVHGFRSQETLFGFSKVNLYAGKELLGVIGIEHHGSERKVYVHNHRVAAERSRNQGKAFTKDPKRAVSLVGKMFSRKSPSELINDAQSQIETTVKSLLYTRNMDAHQAVEKVKQKAGEFMIANVARFTEVLRESTLGMELFDHVQNVASKKALVEEVNNITDLIHNKRVASVVVLQGTYVIHYNDTLSTYTNETLPHELRGPLGMLKLTEPKTLLPVGVRIDNDVYLVVPEGVSNAA